MLSTIILSIAFAECRRLVCCVTLSIVYWYTEYPYAKCHSCRVSYIVCWVPLFWISLMPSVTYWYAEYHYSEYGLCQVSYSGMLSTIMLNITFAKCRLCRVSYIDMLRTIMLNIAYVECCILLCWVPLCWTLLMSGVVYLYVKCHSCLVLYIAMLSTIMLNNLT